MPQHTCLQPKNWPNYFNELATALGIRVCYGSSPRRRPHGLGGFWERMIGLPKGCFKKVLGRSHISLPVLQTMIVQVEAVLNNRPLTYTSRDINDPQPLTPPHLLYGWNITRLPHNCESTNLSDPDYGQELLRRKDKTQAYLMKCFQFHWRHEYLTSLREFHCISGNKSRWVTLFQFMMMGLAFTRD